MPKLPLPLSLLLLLLLSAGLALGSPTPQGQAPGRAAPGPHPAEAGPPAKPSRIVSLAPSITEILFALELKDKIVGDTDYCDFPPEARNLPKVGGFKGVNLEALLALKPDLVLATRDGNQGRDLKRLADLGIRVQTYQPSTLAGVLEMILAIGRETGAEPAAQALVSDCQEKSALVRSRTSNLAPVKVLLVYGEDPLVLAGQGTFADDLIRSAGGINIAGDSSIPYPRFSLEEVLARQPEVIVESAMGNEAETLARAQAAWSRWPSLPAVREQRIAAVSADLLARPGPRLFEGLLRIARILHPQAFSKAGPP